MGNFIYLLCILFSQTAYAHVVRFPGQNEANFEPKPQFSNTNAIETTNRIARNAKITTNLLSNTGTSNANLIHQSTANRASGYIEKENLLSQNQVNTKVEKSNQATSKFADIKLAAQNLANSMASKNIAQTNFQGNYPNFGYAGLSNFGNNRPDLNQSYRSNFANPLASTLANPLYGNIANSYNSRNTLNPFANSFNKVNSNLDLPSFGNGNIASGNIANALSSGSLANAITPGAKFSIGGNPFTVLSGLPGNQQTGLSIVADALEVDGSVSVAGKMPFYGTVALSGILPADGTATANYGCT